MMKDILSFLMMVTVISFSVFLTCLTKSLKHGKNHVISLVKI